MLILVRLLVVIILFVHNAAASFKDDCLDKRNAQTRSTYIDGRCLSVDLAQLLTQADAQQSCIQASEQGQLAANFDQTKLNLIASMIDLSNGVWTSLILTPNNDTVWFNNKTAQNSSVANPAWTTGFPAPAQGAGILLRFDGLVNAELASKHPALCESFEKSPQQIKFNGGSNLKASGTLLSVSTVNNQHQCGINCAEDPRCQAYTYSSSSGQCQLLWLSQQATTLETDPDSKLMTRLHPEADCAAPSDCLAPTDSAKLILVTHYDEGVNFESYYLGHSSLNSILLNSTYKKYFPIAVLLDGKVLITSHSHDAVAGELSRAKETIVYDPRTNTASLVGSAVEARHAPAAAVLDHAVVMCGGMTSSYTGLASCERFFGGQWSTMTVSLNAARWAFGMANLHNQLYAVGGWDGSLVMSVERYDPVTDVWATLGGSMPVPKLWHSHGGVTVFGDQIVVCGGRETVSGSSTDCHAYNDVTDQWSSMAAMSRARGEVALVAIQGYIYAIAGTGNDKSVERFDPQTGQWSQGIDTIQRHIFAAFDV